MSIQPCRDAHWAARQGLINSGHAKNLNLGLALYLDVGEYLHEVVDPNHCWTVVGNQ